MKHCLIILLILSGVLCLVLPSSREYILIQQNKTWNDAQTYCRDRYIDLAVITTTVEMNNLQTAAQKYQFSSRAWIGLYTNINSWYWTMNNETLGSFKFWKTTEPNNFYGNDFCVCIRNRTWSDARCYWPMAFVCFDDRVNASERYVLVTQLKSWSDAQIHCRRYHTDLVSVRDSTENSVIGEMNPSYFTWIGLRRDPWKWTDQTTDVSIIKWWPGSTEDYIKNKSCGYLNNGLAGAEPCLIMLPFFCSAYQIKQQKIIRMKFKSSQDVIDPAITASIEKLKQKLEERGMRNITVTWRKQPDGEVFHKEENITKDITYTGQNCNL